MKIEVERNAADPAKRISYVALIVGRWKLRWWRGDGFALLRRTYPAIDT